MKSFLIVVGYFATLCAITALIAWAVDLWTARRRRRELAARYAPMRPLNKGRS